MLVELLLITVPIKMTKPEGGGGGGYLAIFLKVAMFSSNVKDHIRSGYCLAVIADTPKY